ncbi:MauE/DoxX family redox-associated membrane protein [Peterkaempfera sp. SMS 1(5)a]|uniref:MauE/DoxX family redox-associated membrane protein n=1 Tax=Peterkaempfera podocarpi TaxID=3232308 RepID=UPI003672376E
MDYVAVGCRSLLALVFLASAVGKLRGRAAYAGFLAATRRLAPRWAPVSGTAAAVVGAEAAAVLLVAVPVTAAVGCGLAVALLGGFTLAVLAALRRDERAPCACFGTSRRELGYGQVVRNLLLLTAAALGLAASAGREVPGDPAGVLTAVAVGAVAAALASFADDFIDLFRPIA